jgi:DHA2 family multidrug resistance protein
MSVEPSVRIDQRPSLAERRDGRCERDGAGFGGVAREAAPAHRGSVAGASFMEVLDTTIANVVLPYIAGGMGVSEDEGVLVVTTYLSPTPSS